MNSKRSLIWVIALAAIAAGIYMLTVDSRAPVAVSSNSETPPPSAPSPTNTSSLVPDDGETDIQSDEQPVDHEHCLTVEQLESHPLLVNDAYRFDAVGTTGPTIGAYRGLSSSDLHGLATQRDSAAMAVLGAMAVMRSVGEPEDKAVAYLMHEVTLHQMSSFKRPPDPEAAAHMEEARAWFYKAALHGRLMVLYHVGELLWREKGGPVELGWISKDEYESLSPYQKSALLPSNVYNGLAFEIAPELKSGPLGGIFSDFRLQTERQQQILQELRDQFHLDLESAGLPPISVAESKVPPIEELEKMLCQSELDRLQNEELE